MSIIDYRKIITRYQSGERVAAIARAEQIHPQTVYNVLRRQHIALRQDEKTVADIDREIENTAERLLELLLQKKLKRTVKK